MAVLIRDMDIPKTCIDCLLCHDCECKLTGRVPFDMIENDAGILVGGYTVRPDWCPLQEVTLVAGMYKTQRKENADGN